MYPVLYDFGTFNLFGMLLPVKIYTYGALLAVAFMLGMWVASRQAKALGLPGEWPYDLGVYILVAALVGSRAFYIFFEEPQFYLQHLLQVFNIFRGGLVFYGGFIFSALTLIAYVRIKKMRLWQVADVMTPALPLGHAIGRLGCLMFGCCFGKPWEPGICFPAGSPAFMSHFEQHLLSPDAVASLPVFPTQLIESGLNLVIFTVLLGVVRRKQFTGQIFPVYLMLYAPVRFALEFFRDDWRGGEFLALSVSQWISLALFGGGVAIYHVLRRSAAANAVRNR
ncbi:MAG TPA: prolipoprotein diacylglyceryl transferase [bacterium]|nr:prolipoprotein diacylglyceryl transferase [bacterium]